MEVSYFLTFVLFMTVSSSMGRVAKLRRVRSRTDGAVHPAGSFSLFSLDPIWRGILTVAILVVAGNAVRSSQQVYEPLTRETLVGVWEALPVAGDKPFV